MFNINGGPTTQINSLCASNGQERKHIAPYLTANAIWVNDGALCSQRLRGRIHTNILYRSSEWYLEAVLHKLVDDENSSDISLIVEILKHKFEFS